MKKVLSVLLSVLIMSCTLSVIDFSSHAEISTNSNIATIYSSVSIVKAGETVSIPVLINDNPGILGFKLMFNYDTDVFEPLSVEYGDIISGGLQDNIEGDMIPGSINVYWAGNENLYDNGVLFYVNLNVKTDATVQGYSVIDISYSQVDTFDENFNDVKLRCNKVFIDVIEDEQYQKWYNGQLFDAKQGYNHRSATITAGEQLFLTFGMNNGSNDGEDLLNARFIIEYDKSNFTFLGYTDSDYQLCDDIVVKNDGSVSFKVDRETNSAIAEETESIDIIEHTGALCLAFKANDNARSGDYEFKFFIADYAGVDIAKTTDFSVTVQPSSTSEIAEIYTEDVIAKQNDEITIPVYIENNHGIMGYRLDFEYDADIFQPISVTCGSDFITGSQFNDSIGLKEGEFKVLWNNISELYADGVLLNLKFKVLTSEKIDTSIKMTYSQPDTFNEKYEDVVFDCQNINLSLNAHKHSYTAVVTPPTCTEEGYTTYMCTCGDSYVDDNVSATGHTYGAWKYNGDAVYNSSSDYKNGTQTRTCSVCGESETIEAPNTALLRRRGNSIALESSITLTTYITKDVVDYYDEVYAEFTRNGKTEKVCASDELLTSGSTQYYIFEYSGISPQAMIDDVEITFYGIKDGVKYWGDTYTYSITDYVKTTLAKPDSTDELKTMLVDLMYYGAACQTYQNYKTDQLMTDILTEEQKQYKSTYELELNNIKDASYQTCENRLVRFGTTLRLNDAVEMAIALNMTEVSIEDLIFKVKIGTRELTYTYAENPENFEKGADGYWYFYFDGVYAHQMNEEVFITAYQGNEQVSYTLRYSIESYAAIVTDAKLKAVTDAMMYYGNSAKAYAG